MLICWCFLVHLKDVAKNYASRCANKRCLQLTIFSNRPQLIIYSASNVCLSAGVTTAVYNVVSCR